MRFVKLEAENFKSFEKLNIDLDGHGFVKIHGVNNTDSFSESVGSGKSTIADALSYALTGETVKGNSSMGDVKNMYTNGVCRVAVTFEHNGVEYQIVRGESELKLVEGGVDISKHLKKETQELIEQKFPMFTPTFIGATVIIGQNMPNAFTNNKPSARKQILEELTNSSFMIEEIKSMLAERKNDWQGEIGKIQTDVVVCDTKISSNQQSIVRSQQRLQSLGDESEIRARIHMFEESVSESKERAESLRKDLELANTRYKSLVEQKDNLQVTVSGYQEQLDDARVRFAKEVEKGLEFLSTQKYNFEQELSESKSDYRVKSQEAEMLRNEIHKLKNAPTHCPTCHQPLPDAHTINTTEQENRLKGLISEIDEIVKMGQSHADELSGVEEQIRKYKEEHKSNAEIDELLKKIDSGKHQVSLMSTQISGVTNEINDLNGSIKNFENKISSDESQLNNLRVELGSIASVRQGCEEDIKRAECEIEKAEDEKKRLGELLEKRQARLSTLNQIISFATRDFRTILLSSIIKRLDAYAKSYCKKMLDTTEISFKDDGNNISISYRGRDFGVLSGGESQIVKMCITLALKKTLEDLVGFTTNIMFFDEILDNCDKSTAQQLIELVSGLELGSTFFISHHDDVFLPVDQTWIVTKTDRISTLEVSHA